MKKIFFVLMLMTASVSAQQYPSWLFNQTLWGGKTVGIGMGVGKTDAVFAAFTDLFAELQKREVDSASVTKIDEYSTMSRVVNQYSVGNISVNSMRKYYDEMNDHSSDTIRLSTSIGKITYTDGGKKFLAKYYSEQIDTLSTNDIKRNINTILSISVKDASFNNVLQELEKRGMKMYEWEHNGQWIVLMTYPMQKKK